jgi:hypothetical protein
MSRFDVELLLVLTLLGNAALPPATMAQDADAGVPPRAPKAPPALPVIRPPTELFRQLLAARPAEREQLLAGRSEAQRQALLAKLHQYEAMPAYQRELHLRTFELHWHLTALMRLAPSNRTLRLSTVPEADRAVVANRLRFWDQLPPGLQRDLLEHELAIRLTETNAAGAAPLVTLTNLPPEQRDRLLADIARWLALTPGAQGALRTTFRRLFELTEAERAWAVFPTNQPQPQQIARSLQEFEKLPKADRDRSLTGFQKFTELPPEERSQFLRGVVRWQAMSDEERERWRTLARKSPPPGPPPLPVDILRQPSVTPTPASFDR